MTAYGRAVDDAFTETVERLVAGGREETARRLLTAQDIWQEAVAVGSPTEHEVDLLAIEAVIGCEAGAGGHLLAILVQISEAHRGREREKPTARAICRSVATRIALIRGVKAPQHEALAAELMVDPAVDGEGLRGVEAALARACALIGLHRADDPELVDLYWGLRSALDSIRSAGGAGIAASIWQTMTAWSTVHSLWDRIAGLAKRGSAGVEEESAAPTHG